MTRHTKEPWVRVDRADYAEILPADGSSSPVIAMVGRAQDVDRINACVNALAGIPDPLAFVQAARVLHRALEGVIDATASYLPPDGISKDDCINRVLAASDNADVFHALRAFRAATGGA